MNYEDYFLILDNPPLRSLGWNSLKWMATSVSHATFQPLGWLAWAALLKLFGPSPAAFHAANVAAHAACAAALFLVILELLRAGGADEAASRRGAAGAAALWAVHPGRAEAVSWATQLPDLLSALLALLALLAWLRRRPGAGLALYALAVAARWKAVALPGVLLVLDRYPLRRREFGEKVPYFLVAAGAAALNGLVKTRIAGGGPSLAWSGSALLFQPWKLLRPLPATVYYALGGPLGPGLSAAGGWLGALGATAAAAAVRRRAPAALAAWASYVLLISPVLLDLSAERVHSTRVHYGYLPLAAFFALGAAAWTRLEPSLGAQARRGAGALLAAALLGSGLAARAQSLVWRDSLSLWTHVLAVGGEPEFARPSLAVALASRGRLAEAVAVMEDQVRLFPRSAGSADLLGRLRAGLTAAGR